MQEMTNRLTVELRRLAFESHDQCVSCGYLFKEADTAHLGYGQNGEPLYVCYGCSRQLKETAARQYFFPRPYELPEPSSKLWRYMDFTKYVSLLSSRGLYFTRADCFEDMFEGAKGLKRKKGKCLACVVEVLGLNGNRLFGWSEELLKEIGFDESIASRFYPGQQRSEINPTPLTRIADTRCRLLMA